MGCSEDSLQLDKTDIRMLHLRLELAVLLLDLDDVLDLLLVVLVAQQPTVLGGQLLGLALGNLSARGKDFRVAELQRCSVWCRDAEKLRGVTVVQFNQCFLTSFCASSALLSISKLSNWSLDRQRVLKLGKLDKWQVLAQFKS